MSEKSYYERYWNGSIDAKDGWMTQQDPWSDKCMQRVLRIVSPFVSGNVLDAGCGDGALGEVILKLPGVQTLTGVDIAPKAVELARRRVDNARFEVMTLDNLEFGDSSFDTVLAVEIVEHVLDIERSFEEIARVLKPGGHLIITTTDFNWLKQVFIAMFFFKRYFSPTNPHVRFFTHETLRAQLAKHNLSEILHRWNGSYAGIMPKGQILIAKRNCDT